jgi:hypothetical protein
MKGRLPFLTGLVGGAGSTVTKKEVGISTLSLFISKTSHDGKYTVPQLLYHVAYPMARFTIPHTVMIEPKK